MTCETKECHSCAELKAFHIFVLHNGRCVWHLFGNSSRGKAKRALLFEKKTSKLIPGECFENGYKFEKGN